MIPYNHQPTGVLNTDSCTVSQAIHYVQFWQIIPMIPMVISRSMGIKKDPVHGAT